MDKWHNKSITHGSGRGAGDGRGNGLGCGKVLTERDLTEYGCGSGMAMYLPVDWGYSSLRCPGRGTFVCTGYGA